jgi:hypothetical protein
MVAEPNIREAWELSAYPVNIADAEVDGEFTTFRGCEIFCADVIELWDRARLGDGREGTNSGRCRVVWSVARTSELGPFMLKERALTFRFSVVSKCLLELWDEKSSEKFPTEVKEVFRVEDEPNEGDDSLSAGLSSPGLSESFPKLFSAVG